MKVDCAKSRFLDIKLYKIGIKIEVFCLGSFSLENSIRYLQMQIVYSQFVCYTYNDDIRLRQLLERGNTYGN